MTSYLHTNNGKHLRNVHNRLKRSHILYSTYNYTLTCTSGRAVATPYLGMTLVYLGFGRFQVSETAIKQTQNLKLMRKMQSTGQTDPT